MSGPGGVAGDQLRALVERIEHVDEEIKALTEDKKDIYAEAKGNGFDVKVIREVVRIRKKDPKERDEAESLLDTYLHAIGTAAPLKKQRELQDLPGNRGAPSGALSFAGSLLHGPAHDACLRAQL